MTGQVYRVSEVDQPRKGIETGLVFHGINWEACPILEHTVQDLALGTLLLTRIPGSRIWKGRGTWGYSGPILFVLWVTKQDKGIMTATVIFEEWYDKTSRKRVYQEACAVLYGA